MPLSLPPIPAGWSLDHLACPYDDFVVKRKYIWNNGTMLIPIAVQSVTDNYPREDPGRFGNRRQAAICRTHAPYGYLILSWAAQRTGAEPFVPTPVANPSLALPPTVILISADIDVEAPSLSANGTSQTYRSKGLYIYGLITPIWGPLDGLFEGATPYDTASPSIFPATNFR